MKTETITIGLAFTAAFMSELQPLFIGLGFLIGTDTFTAIWAAIKKEGWSGVQSRKLGRIITKLVMYPLAIIVAKVTENYFALDLVPMVKATAGALALVEVKSIAENMTIVLGFDLWVKIKDVMWKMRTQEKTDQKPNNK